MNGFKETVKKMFGLSKESVDDVHARYATLDESLSQSDSQQTDLTYKLKSARDEFKSILEERDLALKEYVPTVFEILHKKGIVTGKYSDLKNYEQTRITIEISTRFDRSLGVTTHQGLEEQYSSLYSEKLRIETAHDVAKLEQVGRDAEEHFSSKYGKTKVYEKEIDEEISKYAKKHILSKGIEAPRWYYICRRVYKHLNIEKVKPEPRGIATVPGLEEALNKL